MTTLSDYPCTAIIHMERYYKALNHLPTEILSRTKELDEIKHSRWLTRDTFLQMSQGPFAAANGIGQDHLQNFLDLQDAIIAKLLIKRLDLHMYDMRGVGFKLYALLQLIFTESPRLIDFLFSSPTISMELVKLLIENCPAMFHCIAMLKNFKNNLASYPEDKVYFWNFVQNLVLKYPIPATLDLAKDVIDEMEKNSFLFCEDYSIRFIISTIHEVFPHQIPGIKRLFDKYKMK